MTHIENAEERREQAEFLDRIALACGQGSAELLNMVHACRDGHPLNKTAKAPFANLMPMLPLGLPADVEEWMRRQVAAERVRQGDFVLFKQEYPVDNWRPYVLAEVVHSQVDGPRTRLTGKRFASAELGMQFIRTGFHKSR